jgi:hypothetical protein
MMTFEKARHHAEFSRIPEHILRGLYGYVEHRQATGHFLNAVLTNNLFDAISRADKEALAALREIVVFVHMEVRSDAYGSSQKVQEWLFPKPPKMPGHD